MAMKRTQLHCGMVIDPILCALENAKEKWRAPFREMLKRLSYFDLIEATSSKEKITAQGSHSLAAVYSNFISRGLPTRSSPFLNDVIKELFQEISYTENNLGGFGYEIEQENDALLGQLVKTFCLIDPRIEDFSPREITTWEKHLGSEFEERFLYEIVPQVFGEFAIQLFETQKSINDLIDYTLDFHQDLEELINRPVEDFERQHVDFSLEFPFTIKGKRGIVIEIDGSQHEEQNQKYLDQLRDDALRKVSWEVIRLKTKDFGKAKDILKPVRAYFDHVYFKRLKEKFEVNFVEKEAEKSRLILFGSSFLAGRIQKALLHLILSKSISLDAKTWTIGILERDVPAAYLAIEDFKVTFQQLLRLAEYPNTFPSIDLHVYNSETFKGNLFEQHFEYESKNLEEVNSFEGDIFIDVSLLQRTGLTQCPRNINATKQITLRSSHSVNSFRNIYSAPFLAYPTLLKDGIPTEAQESLRYFLHYFFRKKDFRDGQIEIIDRALQGKSVIGLLPTGGGKSLTYQICSLLQPGTALVIDPIKSLMKDQYEGLLKNYIDAGVFINSSIRSQLKRNIAERKLMKGEVLFAFVSPERLQINKFRTQIHEMHQDFDRYFSYCVIDEAHCVSEWGHDFRTSYLRLGENVRNHCKSLDKETIPFFGLTATASFDVLSDVKRELDLQQDDVVRRDSAKRGELFFNVIQSKTEIRESKNEFEVSQAIGLGKQSKLAEWLHTLPKEIDQISKNGLAPEHFIVDEFYECDNSQGFRHSILVFCPYKSDRVNIGVKSVAANLSKQINTLQVGTYFGSDGMDEDSNRSEQNQEDFINNKTNVLIATKAFGMGIDKSNIRATVHINFPSSIESFVQESGRAGRDKKAAVCTVILSDQEGADKAIPEGFHASNFKGKEKEKAVLMELLREITLPIQNQENRLTEYIFQETGHFVKVNFWPKDEPERLYINSGFKKGFGYISLTDLKLNTRSAFYPTQDCKKVLASALTFIQKENTENLDFVEFFNQILESKPLPGIETLLNRIDIGEELDNVMLGFRNDRINRITEILQHEVDILFTERMVSEASEYAKDIGGFSRSLKGRFKKYTEDWPSGDMDIVQDQVTPLFIEIRNEQDTYKAIYRLSIVGVIDDYVVDYNSKTLNLTISKKKDDDYIESLRKYLSRYLSNTRVSEKLQTLGSYEGSTIQKCLKCLIDFVYEEIGRKRFAAISSMEEACQDGLLNGGESMKKYIELYFNSKFLYELNECTHNGKEFTPDIVWHFINKVGGSIDSWNQLRGSATRLLNDQPNNGALLLLRSYSVILLESKELFIERAQEDLVNGLIAFEEEGYDIEEIILKFEQAIEKQNPDKVTLAKEAIQVLQIKKHRIWLQSFNKKFYKHGSKITS